MACLTTGHAYYKSRSCYLIVETELFVQTYKSHGLEILRHLVLDITATVKPFENGWAFSGMNGAAPITVAVQDPDGLTTQEEFLLTIAGDILIEF